MKKFTVVAVLTLGLHSTSAMAAAPQFGTRDGELACAGLMAVGLAAASASKPPEQRVVNAIAMALGFYVGRLSRSEPGAKKQDIQQAMGKLTPEEKGAYANQCLEKAGDLMTPTLS